MITLNKWALFITICLAPTFTLGDLPETVIDKDALNKPCNVNSIVQEDILVCFSKSYLLAQKELNNNYSIAQKQKNVNIRNYLIHQQRQWNKNKFDECLILPEKEVGREGIFEYLQCATDAILKRNSYLKEIYVCGNEPCQFEEPYFFQTIGHDKD